MRGLGGNAPWLLRDGSIATIRSVNSADAPGLQRFIRNLSSASRYLRFLMGIRELPEDMLFQFTHPAANGEAVLLATTAHAGIIGMTQYVVDDDDRDGCEFAIVVSDAWQRQGLGYRMLQALGRFAADSGIRYGHAAVLADNYAMRSLAHKLGCEIRVNAQAPYLLQIRKQFDLAHAMPTRSSLGQAADTGRRALNWR
jgi:acetyltransferase